MTEAETILTNVDFTLDSKEGLRLDLPAIYNSSLGYACVAMADDPRFIAAIGFTGQRQKSISVGNGNIRSVTELEQLQNDERAIKMQARGVGARMYNTPHACIGTGEGNSISAYVFDINIDRIVDRRRHSDGTYWGRVTQAARQAGRILQTKVMGLEATVGKIHASFGDPEGVDAVLYSQSATMELEQRKLGGIDQPQGIPPAFMVIRNPHIIMHKVGEYRP